MSVEQELARTVPVVELLAKSLKAPVSIDTYKPEVARRCVDAGAAMINDVWGVASTPEMLQAVAETGVPYVLMHNRIGHEYGDMMAEIASDLDAAVSRAMEGLVSLEKIILDPGIGFGKQPIRASNSTEIVRTRVSQAANTRGRQESLI